MHPVHETFVRCPQRIQSAAGQFFEVTAGVESAAMMGKRIRDAQPECRSFLPLQDSPQKLEYEQCKSREIGEFLISHRSR